MISAFARRGRPVKTITHEPTDGSRRLWHVRCVLADRNGMSHF
jgi:hypothetical protein